MPDLFAHLIGGMTVCTVLIVGWDLVTGLISGD